MPPGASSRLARPSAQAAASAASAASRPISTGGSSRLGGNAGRGPPPAGAVPRVSCRASSRSMRASRARVSADGRNPHSRHTCCSKRSNVATAAARSARCQCSRIRRRQACSVAGQVATRRSVRSMASATAPRSSSASAWPDKASAWRAPSAARAWPSQSSKASKALKSVPASKTPSAASGCACTSTRTPGCSASVWPASTRAWPHSRRSLNRRWRRLRLACDWLTASGHSQAAARSRATLPSMASSASSAASRGASGRGGAWSRAHCGVPSRVIRISSEGGGAVDDPGMAG